MESDVRAILLVVMGVALASVSVGATNVFEMPLIQGRHRQLQQQLIMHVRAGNIGEMEQVCREGVELLPQDANWRYNLACALAYRKDKGAALDALEQAIELGFRDVKLMEGDRDLAQLHKEERYVEALKKLRKAGKVEGVKPGVYVMGRQAEVQGENTSWDLGQGVFHILFKLLPPESWKISSYSEVYHGPAEAKVREWMKEEVAAGNFGDLYVNRDNGHSMIAVTNFPGLTSVSYSSEAQQYNVHLGVPNAMFSQPVVGNSSMSLTQGPFWRSLPRAILSEPTHSSNMVRLYIGNQIWVFPEHNDHDPELGDLYMVNTPYYVISQGSSYSDKPFVEAFAATMAAFKPAVKRRLIESGQLASTLQMILRSTQKQLKKPEDYLTSLAHPVVFDAKWLDVDAMVEMAQGLELDKLAPMVALRVVEDLKSQQGVDHFDLNSESLLTTAFSIGRILRNKDYERRMVVEGVAATRDGGAKLKWVVLQGDPEKISIKPLNSSGSRVEISIRYHGNYRPMGGDGIPARLFSSRVDIGCFAVTESGYSAPSFISFSYLPDEERVFNKDGRLLSIDYSNSAKRYADPLLTMQKGWKDLYSYDQEGRLRGWHRTRTGGAPQRFTWMGHRVLASDQLERPIRACGVQYIPKQIGESNPPVLTAVDQPQHFSYSYRDDQDMIGSPAPVDE